MVYFSATNSSLADFYVENMNEFIKIRGARQHNLKNINLDIPKNQLVILTGVSGSGKSSLAFDTIYAEGQRRYVESLSSYARQFLGIMEKPDVDSIEGLSPAISIDQKTTSHNPRSTVGTVTEVYDYLRLLFARTGHPHCPVCGREIAHQSLDQIVDGAIDTILQVAKTRGKAWFFVLSPIVNAKKGEYSQLFDNLKAKGYKSVRVDGYTKDLSEDLVLIKTNKHSIAVVADRISLVAKDAKSRLYIDNLKSRLRDAIQQSLDLADGNVIFAEVLDSGFSFPSSPKKFRDHLFSERFACPIDNIQIPEIEPRTFSFNSPQGACTSCSGLGRILKVEEGLVISGDLSIMEGGILPFAKMFENDTWFGRLVLQVCADNKIPTQKPLKEIDATGMSVLLAGTGEKEYKVYGTNRFGRSTYIYEKYTGIVAELQRRYQETESDWVREEIKKYMRERTCEDCGGNRLKKEALSITILGKSISEVSSLPIEEAINFIEKLLAPGSKLNLREKEIAGPIVKEIVGRLGFLVSVGLEYLTLARASGSLSGGEAQRIRLASQIGSGLTGVLYVLDEPTIGLHPRDNLKLIGTLKKLKDLGNTVIVVEHDSEMMRKSDHIVDFGPGAGKLGGQIVASGDYEDVVKNNASLTGKYLSGKKLVWQGSNLKNESLSNKLKQPNKQLRIIGCTKYNLKNITVNLPLEKLVAITGVSGSGKSSLLVETLYPAIMARINPNFKGEVSDLGGIEGVEHLDKVSLIDQSPIGRTPRSNPATYTGVFDPIRDMFATTREAKLNGYKKGRFSFNIKGGRCESCEGQGQIKIEMQFMSDIWVTCDVCHGKRYNSSTLEVYLRGKNIADVLGMTVADANEFFHSNPKILQKISTLSLVGLDYMELGQSATTLSGGEAQRVKLATELSKKDSGKTLYILDEPTTGLHFADVEKLLLVLKMLVAKGNSVFVIEHNTDVIKAADWLIDLGPEGGDGGGYVVAQGKPADIKKHMLSYTGKFL